MVGRAELAPGSAERVSGGQVTAAAAGVIRGGQVAAMPRPGRGTDVD